MVRMEKLQEVDHVVTAFREYLNTSNESHYTALTHEELVKTLNVYAPSRADRETGWYKAIERRVAHLDEEERYKRRKQDVWKDRGIGVLIGVIGTVIGGLILWYLLPR